MNSDQEGNEMAKEVDFGVLRCNCGYEGNFFERTIREMKKISRNSKQTLSDDSHAFIFERGKLTKAKRKDL